MNKKFSKKAINDYLKNANVILTNTKKASESFHNTFRKIRKMKKGGPLTESEKDLLRAMVLFSASGLDAVVKQLVKDCFEIIIKGSVDPGVKLYFEKYIKRKIEKHDFQIEDSKDNYMNDNNFNIKFIASIFANENPHNFLIKNIIRDLTNNSLQSVEQLLKVAACFGIITEKIINDIKLVENIFKIRNEIAHEMDVDFSQSNRNRRSRKEKEMFMYKNTLIKIAELFIKAVYEKVEEID